MNLKIHHIYYGNTKIRLSFDIKLSLTYTGYRQDIMLVVLAIELMGRGFVKL